MTFYPCQLQQWDTLADNISEPVRGDSLVIALAYNPPTYLTVNKLLDLMHDTLYPTFTNRTRRVDRFRRFDTSFGDVVIYPSGTAIAAGKTYRQIVTALRAAWKTYASRGTASSPKTGLATSVQY